MKGILFSLITCFCFSCFTNAQESLKTRNIFLQVGTVNSGLHTAAGIEKLFGIDQTNSILFALNYQRLTRSVEVTDMILKEQNAFFSVGYRKYFPISNRVSPYVGANLLAGYQHQGPSSSGIYEHIASHDFLYGAGTHAGIAYRLSLFSLFLEGSYLFELDHSWLLSAGIKYYF